MDITDLDRATGRLIVQVRLDEIVEALRHVELETDTTSSYRILRLALEHQLEIIDEEGNDHDDPGNQEDTPLEKNSDTGSGDDIPNEEPAAAIVVEEEEEEEEEREVPVEEIPEPGPEPETTATCRACGDTKLEKATVQLSCTHVYCHECVIDLFSFSLHKDASLFPPRCCNVPISEHLYTFLPEKLLDEVNTEKTIFDSKQTTFCSTCWAFVPDDMIQGSVATCGKCQTKTCSTCKNDAHEGLCPEDDTTKLLIATAKKVKWRQCSSCKNMVELSHGCAHIICRCHHQFCYVCGKKWKTCSCVLFDERHVLRPTPTEALEMAPIVCQHSWEQHPGTICARCDRTDLKLVMQCSTCHVEQCTRCVNNSG